MNKKEENTVEMLMSAGTTVCQASSCARTPASAVLLISPPCLWHEPRLAWLLNLKLLAYDFGIRGDALDRWTHDRETHDRIHRPMAHMSSLVIHDQLQRKQRRTAVRRVHKGNDRKMCPLSKCSTAMNILTDVW